jgi:hypothetical protein
MSTALDKAKGDAMTMYRDLREAGAEDFELLRSAGSARWDGSHGGMIFR